MQTNLLALARPENEGKLYHDEVRQGFFTIGWSTQSGRRRAASAFDRISREPDLIKRRLMRGPELGAAYEQRSFPLQMLSEVLGHLDRYVPLSQDNSHETTSIWLSQGEFSRPNRQKLNLARISVCWVDLDLHHENSRPALRAMGKDEALKACLDRCQVLGIPMPSVVLWTGRGLVLKWVTDVLPKAAYPRWAAVQRFLVEGFSGLGADASARDASRILRLPGTYNPKSGQLCEPIYVNEFWGDIAIHLFDDFAAAVLPYTREHIQRLREARMLAKQQRARRLDHHLRVIESERGTSGNLRAFNPVRLAWLQVDDYRKLAAIRPMEVRPEGWTNTIVWMAASALAVAVWADADRFDREFIALATELAPHWPQSRVLQSVSSVRSRMQMMARGEWVEHRGRKRPSVYTPKHSTILRELGITDSEAEQLAVIISPDLKRERQAQRKKDARMAAGAVSREIWLAEHTQAIEGPWLAQGMSRATWYRKGKPRA